MDIDPVQKRAGDLPPVAVELARRAGALVVRVGKISAGAGVHRRYEHEGGRVGDRGHRAGDRHLSVFERLAQHLEGVSLELRDLVEEEHCVACFWLTVSVASRGRTGICNL